MDTDDARRASEEIYRRIRQQTGLNQSSSVGDMTLQPETIRAMAQSRLVLHRGTVAFWVNKPLLNTRKVECSF